MPLAEKYAPLTLNQVCGNDDAIGKLMKFGSEAHSSNRKPLLLYGASGTGKTASAHALAYSNGFEILEFNASDYRSAEVLSKTLLPASKSSGLFARKLLIIMDEIDERSDKFDAGSEKVVMQLLKETRHPVIFIANDFWDRKIAFLRELVEKVEFKRIPKGEIKKMLETVLKKENASMDDAILDELASRSNGDIRGSLNDLELMIQGTPALMDNIGTRDRKLEVYGVLDKIFLTKSFDGARNAYMNTDLDGDMLLNWIDENIPNRYSWKSDLVIAYSQLARASFFQSQASRKSYYGYLRYSSILMSSGVSMAVNGEVVYMKSYQFPNNIRQLSKSKSGRSALAGVVTKLIYVLHTHKKEIFNSHLQMLKGMIKEGMKENGEEETYAFFQKAYNLEDSDVDAILNYA